MVLHTLTGALGGGIQGALGAGGVAAAAPQIDEWQRSVVSTARAVTSDLGINDGYATMFGQAFGQLTSSGLGAALGSGTGAGFALAVDTNNRQLHQSELQRIKELAKGDKAVEQRLLAAACALVHCADGVPRDDPNYELLAKLQAIGAGMKSEQALLSSQIGRNGRVTERLFQYSWVDAYLIEPATRTKMVTRTAGGGQFVLGGLGVAASGAACVTGWGCAAGLVGGTVSLDYAQAGLRQAWNGTTSVPYGEQVLRSFGASDEGAALGYGLLGLSAAAVEGAIANRVGSTWSRSKPELQEHSTDDIWNAVFSKGYAPGTMTFAGARFSGGSPTMVQGLQEGSPAIARNGERLVLDQRYVTGIGDYACGPTACAMVLNDVGRWQSITNLAHAAGLRPGYGTDVDGLVAALRTNGLTHAHGSTVATIDDIARATANGEAAIAMVELDRGAHFVVVDGITKRAGRPVVAVRDPGNGAQYFVPTAEFESRLTGGVVFTNTTKPKGK